MSVPKECACVITNSSLQSSVTGFLMPDQCHFPSIYSYSLVVILLIKIYLLNVYLSIWQSICTSFYLSIYLPIPFVYIYTGFSKWMIRRHFIPNANITPGFLHNRVSLTFIIIIVEIKNNCLRKAGWLYHKYLFYLVVYTTEMKKHEISFFLFF